MKGPFYTTLLVSDLSICAREGLPYVRLNYPHPSSTITHPSSTLFSLPQPPSSILEHSQSYSMQAETSAPLATKKVHTQAFRTCLVCNKEIRKQNFARHTQQHNNSHKIRCSSCDILICKSVWRKHLKTQKHQASIRPSGSICTKSSVLEILESNNEALGQLSSAYGKEIEKAGGLTLLDPSRDNQKWAELGLRLPMLFPADECWREKPPSLDTFLVDLLDKFDKTTTKIYRRGSPYHPCKTVPIHTVIQQLQLPEVSGTLYAVNMATSSAIVRIPERLYDGQDPVYKEESILTTTNITPKFSASDLHVDHGRHVVTLLYGGCVKLWALYPLTPHNLQQMSEAYRSNAVFIDLQGKLEGGEFCVQTEDQAIYLPPGCIHSTITLQGGLAPGIEFTTGRCLDAAGSMWDLNSSLLRVCKDDCVPLVEAILLGLRSDDESQRRKAMASLCTRYSTIAKLKPAIFSQLKKQIRGNCSRCEFPWRKH
ncbi:hypothetical protein F4778DRAFT_720544 [Xylariomycetidae sp. FL2044]|nr:hypothetical protein F4778DRAFT_720544 [Xylariomycetidae sp. FL2044]